MLHQPLGAESKDKENAAACLKRPTGKTGVAIGLVQCRPGSVIKVISERKRKKRLNSAYLLVTVMKMATLKQI